MLNWALLRSVIMSKRWKCEREQGGDTGELKCVASTGYFTFLSIDVGWTRSDVRMTDSELAESLPAANLYHNSVCGSILYSVPTSDPSVVFSYLAHSRFDAFHRALSVFPKEIPRMKNALDQVRRPLRFTSMHSFLSRRCCMS